MIHSKNVYFLPNPRAAGVLISIGWKSETNWFVYNKLKRNEPCTCPILGSKSELTSYTFGIFQNFIDQFIRDPIQQNANRISNVSCNFQHGEFFITAGCAATLSSVRKCIILSMRAINSGCSFVQYKQNMNLLNGSANKEEYNFCANEFAKECKSLKIIISGKININKEKLDMLAESVVLRDFPKPESLSTPASQKLGVGKTEFPSFESPPIGKAPTSMFLMDYLAFKISDPLAILDDSVIIRNLNWKNSDKLLESAEKYAERFKKVDPADLPGILAYSGLSRYLFGPCIAICMTEEKITSQKISEAIKKSKFVS